MFTGEDTLDDDLEVVEATIELDASTDLLKTRVGLGVDCVYTTDRDPEGLLTDK